MRLSTIVASALSIVGTFAACELLEAGPPQSKQSRRAYGPQVSSFQVPILFEKNMGQWDDGTDFLAATPTMAVKTSRNSLSVTMAAVPDKPSSKSKGTSANIDPSAMRTSTTVIKLAGSREGKPGSGMGSVSAKSIYGANAKGKRFTAPLFERVVYSDVYPGIDVNYDSRNQGVELAFVVKPNKDPGAIALDFGPDADVELQRSGMLSVRTDVGALHLGSLKFWAVSKSQRTKVSGTWVSRGNGVVGFSVGPYDKNATLVIDPIFYSEVTLAGYVHGNRAAIAATGPDAVYIAHNIQAGMKLYPQLTRMDFSDPLHPKVLWRMSPSTEIPAYIYSLTATRDAVYIGGQIGGPESQASMYPMLLSGAMSRFSTTIMTALVIAADPFGGLLWTNFLGAGVVWDLDFATATGLVARIAPDASLLQVYGVNNSVPTPVTFPNGIQDIWAFDATETGLYASASYLQELPEATHYPEFELNSDQTRGCLLHQSEDVLTGFYSSPIANEIAVDSEGAVYFHFFGTSTIGRHLEGSANPNDPPLGIPSGSPLLAASIENKVVLAYKDQNVNLMVFRRDAPLSEYEVLTYESGAVVDIQGLATDAAGFAYVLVGTTSNKFGVITFDLQKNTPLKITKVTDPSQAREGDVVAHYILLENTWLRPQTNVKLMDNVPTGQTIISVDAEDQSSASFAGQSVECTFPSIGPGERTYVQIVTKAEAAGHSCNTASVNADDMESVSSTDCLTVEPCFDIHVQVAQMEPDYLPTRPGQNPRPTFKESYSISVQTNGRELEQAFLVITAQVNRDSFGNIPQVTMAPGCENLTSTMDRIMGIQRFRCNVSGQSSIQTTATVEGLDAHFSQVCARLEFDGCVLSGSTLSDCDGPALAGLPLFPSR